MNVFANEFTPLLTFPLWLFLMYGAWLLAAGPKLTVLYLRKFRSGSAQAAVTSALERGLSKRYRIVTLDDSSFLPIEVPRMYRRISRYAGPLILVVFVTVVVTTVTWLANEYAPTITNFMYGVILAVALQFLAPILLAIPAVIMAVGVALLLKRRTVRKRAKLFVGVHNEIDKAELAVSDLSAWSKRSTFLAPQATVIEVRDELWRAAVSRLVARADVVLVDVSVNTESLQWELALLANQSFRRTVLIANKSATSSLEIPVHCPCLKYDDHPSSADQKAFVTALLALFDTSADGQLPFSLWEWVVRPITAFVRTLVLLAVLAWALWWLLLLVASGA